MNKEITQLNTISLKDGVRIAVTYSAFKEDKSLYSNNNKISFKIEEDEVLKQHLEDLFSYIKSKIN